MLQNVCLSALKVQVLKPDLQCDGTWGRCLWEGIRTWGQSLRNESSALTKDHRVSFPATSAMWGDSGQWSTNQEVAGQTLILFFDLSNPLQLFSWLLHPGVTMDAPPSPLDLVLAAENSWPGQSSGLEPYFSNAHTGCYSPAQKPLTAPHLPVRHRFLGFSYAPLAFQYCPHN